MADAGLSESYVEHLVAPTRWVNGASRYVADPVVERRRAAKSAAWSAIPFTG
jgi:hypothetical protein